MRSRNRSGLSVLLPVLVLLCATMGCTSKSDVIAFNDRVAKQTNAIEADGKAFVELITDSIKSQPPKTAPLKEYIEKKKKLVATLREEARGFKVPDSQNAKDFLKYHLEILDELDRDYREEFPKLLKILSDPFFSPPEKAKKIMELTTKSELKEKTEKLKAAQRKLADEFGYQLK